MSKSYAELVDWSQRQDAIRIILVHIEGFDGGPLYLSNKPYITEGGDTPSSVAYVPCLVGSLSFTEQLDVEGGTASIGYGTVDINNHDGVYDIWKNYIWKNKPIQIYLGDPRWNRADFIQIFDGLIDDVASSDRSTVSISLYNKLERLNTAISEKTITTLYPSTADEVNINITPIIPWTITNATKPVGAVQSRDTLLPLCFGECFNVTPLKISTTLTGGETNVDTYMVHDGQIEAILEVRDNGVPLTPGTGYTVDLVNGTFTLLHAPFGTITCDVQGAKPSGIYLDSIGTIIKHIVTTYGVTKYVDADIDLDTLAAYNSYYTGVYITDRENVFDICQRLANSVGASLSQQYDGKLTMSRLTLPGYSVTAPIVTEITEDNINYNGISIQERVPVKGAVKLGYAYNWTEQSDGLAGAVPQQSIDLYKKPYQFVAPKDDMVISSYSITAQPIEEETLLVDEAQASDEATRRLTLFKTQRTIYSIEGRMDFITMTPGLGVTLKNYRFGLSTPVNGVVVSTSKDWVTGKTTIGVLV